MTTRDVVRRYLTMLGIDAHEPLERADLGPAGANLDLLRLIHRAHQERFPYTNLDIVLGQPPSVDPDVSLERAVDVGRIGYCFHQNGALYAALRELGYAVSRRAASLWQRTTPSTPPLTPPPDPTGIDHLALIVDGLASPTHPTGRWWVDVGLGEGFLAPLPLRTGHYVDGTLQFWLTDAGDDRWALRNNPGGSFTGMQAWSPIDYDVAAGHSDAIEIAHRHLSTPPDGHFAKYLVVQRRRPDGIDILRGCTLTLRRPDGASERREVLDYRDWLAALTSMGLSTRGIDLGDLRALFERQRDAHQEWVKAGRP